MRESHYISALIQCLKYHIVSCKQLDIHIRFDPAFSLQNIYHRKMKTCVYAKTYAQPFVAVLFIIYPNQKQPELPYLGDWIDKQCYIHVTE